MNNLNNRIRANQQSLQRMITAIRLTTSAEAMIGQAAKALKQAVDMAGGQIDPVLLLPLSHLVRTLEQAHLDLGAARAQAFPADADAKNI
jgi:hypothetical protein